MPKDSNIPPPAPSKAPAISIIIPMYNVEKYIGECLDSVLAQTFLDFEVIVIDDCSTDSGFEIAKSYVKKFGGRLKLAQMKTNSGFASRPRNVGLQLASGEYIFFVDSDDFIMPNALETLYAAIKEYDADVVYYSSNYDIRQPNDIYLHKDGFGLELLKEGLEDKPDLTVNNPDKILREFLLFNDGNLTCTWTKLIRRDLLLENKIFFPNVSLGEDFIWCINVYCHAKKFLRIPTPLYFYRRYDINTLSHTQKSPAEEISRWFREFAGFIKFLKELEDQTEVLSRTPAYCLAAARRQFLWCLSRIREETAQLSTQEIYEILRREFSDDVSGLMVPFFFNLVDSQKNDLAQMRRDFSTFIARADIQLIPKTGAGDFFILSVSDEKAEVKKPAWFQKRGVGYQIQSYAGNLDLMVKATADGKIRLNLMGLDIRDPADNSKRIPSWIDYTKLTVNGTPIFNSTIAAWHDKPYTYTFEVKADDEITLQIEWLPHKSASLSPTVNKLRETIELPATTGDAPAVSIIIPVYNAEKFIGEALESILTQTLQSFEVIVVDDCSTDNSCAVVESYISKFGGRLSLYHMIRNSGCAPAPRNNGFLAARGEYTFFMDSDDTLTKTALEEMYSLAKEYGADVVYCEKYYMSTGVGEEYVKNIHLADDKIQQPPFVDKPTFVSDKLSDRLDELFKKRFWVTPWQRFVSRKLLVDNEITFPEIIGSDDVVWCFLVLCCAKKFLRVPNACYVRRMYEESFTQSSKKSPNKHIRQWMDITIRGVKFVNKFMDKLPFFRENLAYRYRALDILASLPFDVVAPACATLNPEKVYDIFMTEFSKETGDNNSLVSLLCTNILGQSNQRTPKPTKSLKEGNPLTAEQQAQVEQFKAKVADFLASKKRLPALSSDAPAISVVIPMYNMEEYVADCLNSLLVQTFQDFEVIVVDDCSEDNSVNIVKSYAEKFGGRLKLAITKENSGGAGYVPRNIGLNLSRGEYIFFMDPDDFTLDNTLETLYNAARKYDTDVVYTSAHYRLDESNEFRYLLDGYGKELRNKGLPDEQALIVDNPDKNLQRLLLKDDFHMPFVKLVRRDFLIDNKIVYPKIISSGDYIWTIHVYCCSKRFLRLPVPLYFYRQNPKSITEERRAPKEQIIRCVKALVLGLDSLTELSNKFDLLKQNSTYFRYAFMPFLRNCLRRTIEARNQLNAQEIYDILRREFPDVAALEMFPFLFSIVAEQAQRLTFSQENFETVLNSITARMDIKLTPQDKGGELQLISLSDKKADVRKPAWLQRDGNGYQIQSCEGDMEAVFKVTADGQIRLNLLGLDVRDAEDKSKRVPSWIDYTYLTINGKNILNKITPAWHDKPYSHKFEVKAGDELKIQVEWLPHRKTIRENVAPTVSQKFLPHLTARLDMQLKPATAGGDFKIISVSDKNAAVWKPDWLQKEGVGYQIHSYNGSIEIVAKVTADGQIKMDFRSIDIRDKKDKSKRVPYWIDYTALTINGKNIFNKTVSAWHDEPYHCTLNVKAGQEIKLRTEWSPHRDDVLIPSVITIQENVTPPVSKKFLPYLTSRLDMKLETTDGGDLQIVNLSDKKAIIKKAAWLTKNNVGCFIQSHVGELDIVAKVIGGGKLILGLRGTDVRDTKDDSKRIPYWIDYTKFTINGKVIFDTLTPTWHDKPYNYTLNVKSDEEIIIHTEWLPHKGDVPAIAPTVAPPPIQSNAAEILNKFKRYFSIRLDLKMITSNQSDFQIVSISDDTAEVRKPTWFNRNGVGYVIQSYVGKLTIVFKIIEDGTVNMDLKGLFYANPKDKSKGIPYWVDYTKFTVNGKVIFNKLTPICHDKPYNYKTEAKAGEDITVDVEWLPHRSDT